jgi:hypothetical protein
MNLHSKSINKLTVSFLGKISINLVHLISGFSRLGGYLVPFDEAALFLVNYEDFLDLFEGFLFVEHVLNQRIN